MTVVNAAGMKSIAFSEFRTRCVAILEEVRLTRQPVVITRSGVRLAEVVPPRRERKRPEHWLGSLVGTARIVGDIVSPASDERDWEALNLSSPQPKRPRREPSARDRRGK